MNRMGLVFVLGLAFALPFSGCKERNEAPAPSEKSAESTEESVAVAAGAEVPEIDDTPLDVDNPNTPEGVVNEFFKTFFSGDDDGAFALLTSRAQNAKRDNFLAQESDTVRWRITKKMKPIRGRVLVLVDVEDYTDAGAIQLDELTFVLTNDDVAWRIAGFSVGELAIDFEDALQETFVQESRPAVKKDAPVRTASAVDGTSVVR